MRVLLLASVFLVGFLMPVQAGLNAVSAGVTQSRLQACLMNGLVYVAILVPVMLLINAFGGRSFAPLAALAKVPWWAHLAGVIGAALVLAQLTAAPQVGAALMVAIFVAGQASGSIAADHFGFPGYSVIRTHPERYIGLALVVVGAIMVARPWAGSAPEG
ncbi:MAG: DMT family transporter [Phycisphaerales bacterium]|jgi:transporter family-2 protein